jgi:hypothetical protein
MDRFLDILTVVSVVVLVIVLRGLRREHIRVEHSVSWLAAAVLLLLVSRSSRYLGDIAAALGLHERSLTVMFLAMIVFLGVFYRFSRVVSELKDMNITLTQRVAMLEYRIRERQEKIAG